MKSVAAITDSALSANDIAGQIIENSPSIALRSATEAEGWATRFITRNIASLGYAPDDFVAGRRTWADVVHPEDLPEIIARITEYEQNGTDTFTLVYRVVRADGSAQWVSDVMTAARDGEGKVTHYDCVVSDYTQTREHLGKIRSIAVTDQLTGLYNRHHLESRVADALARARAEGTGGYLLFLDLDNFKGINDAYGHDYGDALLREIAGFLREFFGDPECVFRFGGDEFVALLEPEKAERIHEFTGGLLARARQPWQALDRQFHSTLSVGVVRYPDGKGDAAEIIKNADVAMYRAKKQGKNSYTFYTADPDGETPARAEIELALRESVANGFAGFSLAYQPLATAGGRMTGAEALLRWTLNGRQIAPEEFVPLAEYLGLIVPLGDYALREAAAMCRLANACRKDFFISVNVSVKQFRQEEFPRGVLDILGASGVNMENIVLEITEGMAIHDIQRMKALGEELGRHGVTFAMDDFGTGHSSLATMRELPVGMVKIDRSLIRDAAADAYAESFVRGVSDLVHSTGRKVCVEGVETEAQYRFCRECGADYLQGFYLWKPMAGEDLIEAILEECALREASA